MSDRLTPEREAEIAELQARQRVADQILPIIFATNVSRAACLTEQPEDIPLLTARRIADNVKAWVASGDWLDRPLTDLEYEQATRASVPALLAELAAVRAERDEFCDRVDTLTAAAKGNKRHVQELFLELQKAHARIRELERPAIEAARNAIRRSYTGLIAQAEQDRDPEGAAHLRDRLRDREAQWKREDEEAAR